MNTSSSLAEQLEALGPTFSGQLLTPNDDGYDEARQLHNGMIDKRPAVVARCAGVADVVDAVQLGRRNDLEIAIRGGGHNVAGRATVDGGVMIDLSAMKGIHVDPGKRTVVAQGGGGSPGTSSIERLRCTGLRPREEPLARPASRGSRWAAASVG